MSFSIDSKLKELLKDEGAREVLNKYVPDLVGSPKLKMVQGMSFRKISEFPQAKIPAEVIEKIDNELKTLG